MWNPNLSETIRIHREELERQAEAHNRAQALRAETNLAPFHALILNQIGQHLITWGEHLQTRYGDLLEETQEVKRRNTSSTVGY